MIGALWLKLTGWVTRKAWPYILLVGAASLVIFQAKRNGAIQRDLDIANGNVRKIERMRDAVANTPTDRRSVVKRLRDGNF